MIDQTPEDENNGSVPAFADLVSAYRPLIDALVSRFKQSGVEEEDLSQEALIALYSAYQSYDFSQNQVSFGLYAKVCIRNRLISLARRGREDLPMLELGDEDRVEGAIEDPEQTVLDKESYGELLNWIDSSLSELEKKVLVLYLQQDSYARIAQRLSLSEKVVDNAICRLKAKLRKRK